MGVGARISGRCAVLVIACAAIVAGGCGVGDKQHDADAIVAGRRAVTKSGGVNAVIHYRSVPKRASSAVRESTDGGGLAPGLGRQGPAALDVAVQFDFAHGATVVDVPTPPAAADGSAAPTIEGPDAMFDGDVAFVQRVNRRPAERRVWARLDFRGLDEDERAPDQTDYSPDERLETVAKTINPQLLLDLVDGTLAGSVERVGTDAVDGVDAVAYRANVSIEKSSTELGLDEDALATRKRVFALAGISRDVNPARYWLGRDGRLVRASFTFDQALFPRIHNTVSVVLDLQQAAPTSLAMPPDDLTVRLKRYPRFVRSAVVRGEA